MNDVIEEVLKGLDESRVTPYNDPVPSDYVISRQSMKTALLQVQEAERERHRKELLALVDGLEHFAVLDDETGANARALLHSIEVTVQLHGEARA